MEKYDKIISIICSVYLCYYIRLIDEEKREEFNNKLRESLINLVNSVQIVNKIDELGRKAYYIKDFDDIYEFLKRNVKPNDIVITQGAGTITKLGHKLVKPEEE